MNISKASEVKQGQDEAAITINQLPEAPKEITVKNEVKLYYYNSIYIILMPTHVMYSSSFCY